jgi:hypothetical protein
LSFVIAAFSPRSCDPGRWNPENNDKNVPSKAIQSELLIKLEPAAIKTQMNFADKVSVLQRSTWTTLDQNKR